MGIGRAEQTLRKLGALLGQQSDRIFQTKNIGQICESAFGVFGAFWDWISCDGYEYHPDPTQQESAYAEIVALQSALLVVLGGLLVYADRERPFDRVAIAYVALSCIPLWGLLTLMRVTNSNDSVKKFAFNRGTIMYAKWAFRASILVVVVGAVAAAKGFLPGQGERSIALDVRDIRSREWQRDSDRKGIKRGDPGAEASVIISPSSMPNDALPQPLRLTIAIAPPYDTQWTIGEIYGYEGTSFTEGSEESASRPSIHREEGSGKTAEWSVLWPGLSRKTYVLRVLLHSKGEPGDVDKFIATVKENPRTVLSVRASY